MKKDIAESKNNITNVLYYLIIIAKFQQCHQENFFKNRMFSKNEIEKPYPFSCGKGKKNQKIERKNLAQY